MNLWPRKFAMFPCKYTWKHSPACNYEVQWAMSIQYICSGNALPHKAWVNETSGTCVARDSLHVFCVSQHLCLLHLKESTPVAWAKKEMCLEKCKGIVYNPKIGRVGNRRRNLCSSPFLVPRWASVWELAMVQTVSLHFDSNFLIQKEFCMNSVWIHSFLVIWFWWDWASRKPYIKTRGEEESKMRAFGTLL